MSEYDGDNAIEIPCVGVCIVDEAGYCLGCGRPPAPVTGADEANEANDSPHAQAVLANAVSTTLTQ